MLSLFNNFSTSLFSLLSKQFKRVLKLIGYPIWIYIICGGQSYACSRIYINFRVILGSNLVELNDMVLHHFILPSTVCHW